MYHVNLEYNRLVLTWLYCIYFFDNLGVRAGLRAPRLILETNPTAHLLEVPIKARAKFCLDWPHRD